MLRKTKEKLTKYVIRFLKNEGKYFPDNEQTLGDFYSHIQCGRDMYEEVYNLFILQFYEVDWFEELLNYDMLYKWKEYITPILGDFSTEAMFDKWMKINNITTLPFELNEVKSPQAVYCNRLVTLRSKSFHDLFSFDNNSKAKQMIASWNKFYDNFLILNDLDV